MKFEELYAIDVSAKVEKKQNLSYLSWSWAWAEFKKKCPNAKYEIKMFNNLAYTYDEKTGYMVFTSVTVDDITHDMWLPVMDANNKAMKSEPYTYKTSYGEKKVASATMFDINKTIMRCLVKNLAMFGLGLYIYNGEDLPETEKTEEKPQPKTATIPSITPQQLAVLRGLKIQANKPLEQLTFAEAKAMIENAEKLKAKKVVKKVVAQEI